MANDKATFSDLVSLVLGPEWTPERHLSRDPAHLGRLLREMAGRHDAVGLKRTRCASAMGNLVLESSELLQTSPADLDRIVDRFLTRTEWPGDEPVLTVAWENAASSPSTQWWIPPASIGRPQLDGIYEQILEGERKVFVGSRPSGLPPDVNARLATASGVVAGALQTLGYVGRCSFDHLVLGDPDDAPTLLFTECNGRWGGTSTPMRLVDRLVDGERPPYRAQDFHHERLTGLTFADILARVGDDPVHATEPVGTLHLLQHRSAGGARQARRHRAGRHAGRGGAGPARRPPPSTGALTPRLETMRDWKP